MTNFHSNLRAKIPMSNDVERNHVSYNLAQRTTEFAKNIIRFSRSLPENALTIMLKNQLLRSGTSIGANYHEADAAESRKDFFQRNYLLASGQFIC